MTYRLGVFIIASLFAQTSLAQLFGAQQIISTEADYALCVHSSDLDGDGDSDVISASSHDHKIAWYENIGGSQFGPQQIIDTSIYNVIFINSSDLDGDGDMDVLSSTGTETIGWNENLGNGNFGSLQIISYLASFPRTVHSADLDSDNDMDVLSASMEENKIAWYENLGGGQFSAEQIITTLANEAIDVYTSDLDNDGDIDVLSASSVDDKIAWYENLGNGQFGAQQFISLQANYAACVYAADLDQDGDMDVLSASSNDHKIAWYENLSGGNFGPQQILSTQAIGALFVRAADLDNDGDIDVVSASDNDNKIAWYENLGGGNFGNQQIITLEANSARCVNLADLDGDGDIDALSASRNDDKIAWYKNLSGEGCMEPTACNYNPNAWIENGSCCFTNCGCTNPIAANYSEMATCDNGTCEFIITGTVFYDENENGIMDGLEYGLPFQTVSIEALNQSYITNDEGNFIANIGQSQILEFVLQDNPVFTFNTTPNPVAFNTLTAESAQVLFGISNQSPAFGICVDLYPNGNGFLCNDYSNHNICFRNMGNVPIDGVLELQYDELFQGFQEVTLIDSIVGNSVFMSFENLLPGQMLLYDIELLTPTSDHIGEYVTTLARVHGFYEGQQVAYGEKALTMEITCSFDPNDKQAFPLGYTDEHWLLQETEQEFLIRFQNTGNAPAQNIRIRDTLDVNFDIESFRLISNSHSVMTSINPQTRLIDLYFENIQLPDSVNDEPNSHGLISYKITPLPNLPIGTVLENTAYIYFDNNNPIITNTTWTTIHECGGEATYETATAIVCNEPHVNFEGSYEFVEDYSWQVDGSETGANSSFLISSNDLSSYEVTYTASNPLCSETIELNFEFPNIELINPCNADFNCDGIRDTEDLLIFINQYGCLNGCETDLDANTIVNVQDLFIFLSLYDESCW